MDSPSNNKQVSTEVVSVMMDSLPMAYVRPIMTTDGKVFAVCTADGTQLATFASEEAAFLAARQNDLEPMFTH